MDAPAEKMSVAIRDPWDSGAAPSEEERENTYLPCNEWPLEDVPATSRKVLASMRALAPLAGGEFPCWYHRSGSSLSEQGRPD